MAELHEATEGARQVARSFHASRELLDIPLQVEIDGASLPAILGLRSKNVAQFLKARNIAYDVVAKRIRVNRDALLRASCRPLDVAHDTGIF
ncbi:hypothetical protein BZM27_50615 [Paraburkholderia steynii]|uniref:Uncharacterized protein n=1 Tax=Paraburkholderia steynii TaxID=1245441 RepID=A0A4R0WZL6_9BURK|nr:hypothetical protein BZM27_50615 [Paraburkholderia steynii]